MNIHKLVSILEDNSLITPDWCGRKWSDEYSTDSLWWNPRPAGIQILRDDGQQSAGIKETIHYDLQRETPYQTVRIETLSWHSTLCFTSFKKEDKLCLVYVPERKATTLEQGSEKANFDNTLNLRNFRTEESNGLFTARYEKGEKQFTRIFRGIEELRN